MTQDAALHEHQRRNAPAFVDRAVGVLGVMGVLGASSGGNRRDD